MAKKQPSVHYVDNKKFLQAMKDWKEECVEAEEADEERARWDQRHQVRGALPQHRALRGGRWLRARRRQPVARRTGRALRRARLQPRHDAAACALRCGR